MACPSPASRKQGCGCERLRVQAPVAPVVTMSVLLEALEVVLLCARVNSPIPINWQNPSF